MLNYHIGRIFLGSMFVGDSVWLGWNGIRLAGFSLQHGYHWYQCGNSTEYSQVPDDGYINV